VYKLGNDDVTILKVFDIGLWNPNFEKKEKEKGDRKEQRGVEEVGKKEEN
jgi:hypothetical protein